ncbi:penicillin binding protein PBP4B, partial [Clostridium sp.]|uniref:penicillin binding protein PBP4B n=1 Tax=Clostridium sp. TaxID=1506 RepID=UPI003F2C6ED0
NMVFNRYRRVFKGYSGKGEIILKNNGATSAKIYINGNLIDLKDSLNGSNSEVRLDIGLYTVDGENTLKVLDVKPKGSSIDIEVLYPELTYASLPEDVGFSSKKLEELDDFINKEVSEGFPGAALIVVKNGEIVKSSSYGYSKKWDKNNLLEEKEEMSVDTLFDIASLTKVLSTNFALQKLVSEGKLNVDDLVVKYLPTFVDKQDAKVKGKSKITIRDVLNHRAGFAPEIRFFDNKNATVIKEGLYSQDREKTIELLPTVPLQYEPGTDTIYSDTDYMILGLIVEEIVGMDLDKYVEENIYKPLGLERTMYNPLEKGFNKEDVAATERNGNTRDYSIPLFNNIREYTLQGEVHDEKAWYSMGGVSGHAGLFSTVEDMAILAQVMLNKGGYGDVKLFDSTVVDEFIKPSDDDNYYGLGWDRQSDWGKIWEFGPYAGNLTIGHTGWTGCVMNIDPENDMTTILLTNMRHSPTKENNFEASKFETGRYGSIMAKVYEAFMENTDESKEDKSPYITKVEKREATQVNPKFPEDDLTSRVYARNRRSFEGYKGKGEIILENNGATSAEVYVNGKAIDISKALKSGKETINIGKYTVDGDNSLKVLNVMPEGASINIKVSYPELTEGKPEDIGIDSERFSKIDKIINSEVELGYSSSALLVIKDGKIIKNSAYGYKQVYDKNGRLNILKPVTTDSLFDLGGATKAFVTNFAIQKLVTEGKININDLVVKYIPTFIDGENDEIKGKDTITIKDLLNHTSGLPNNIEFYDKNVSGEFYSVDRETTIKLLPQIPLEREPKIESIDSDINYMLLGLVIENITEMTLDEYTEEYIYKPLGLENTMFNPLDKGISKDNIVATGIKGNIEGNKHFEGIRDYTLRGEVFDEKAFYSMDGVSGHSGLFSNTKDIAVLMQTLLNEGGYGGVKLFSKEVLDQFTKPDTNNPERGLGWNRMSNQSSNDELGSYASNLTYSSSGWIGAETVIDPKNDLAIVYLTNYPHSEYINEDFDSKGYIQGGYGNIVSMVYEAVMENGEINNEDLIQASKDKVELIKNDDLDKVSKGELKSAIALIDVLIQEASKINDPSDIELINNLISELPNCEEKTWIENKMKTLTEKVVIEKPSNLKASEIESNCAKVTWNSPSNNDFIKEYKVYLDGKLEAVILPGEVLEYEFKDLKSNSIYGVKVVAKTMDGLESKPISINIRTKK